MKQNTPVDPKGKRPHSRITPRQRAVIEAIGKDGKKNTNYNFIHKELGIERKSMHSMLTLFFQRFNEELDIMIEYYPIFERRFKALEKKSKEGDAPYTKLRQLARKIRKESG